MDARSGSQCGTVELPRGKAGIDARSGLDQTTRLSFRRLTSYTELYCAHSRYPNHEWSYKAMTHLLVCHNVADFAKWKPVYDAHLAARQKAAFKRKICCAVSTIQMRWSCCFKGGPQKSTSLYRVIRFALRPCKRPAWLVSRYSLSQLEAISGRHDQLSANSPLRGNWCRAKTEILSQGNDLEFGCRGAILIWRCNLFCNSGLRTLTVPYNVFYRQSSNIDGQHNSRKHENPSHVILGLSRLV